LEQVGERLQEGAWNNDVSFVQLAEYQIWDTSVWNSNVNFAELAHYQPPGGTFKHERFDLGELPQFE